MQRSGLAQESPKNACFQVNFKTQLLKKQTKKKQYFSKLLKFWGSQIQIHFRVNFYNIFGHQDKD